MSHIDITVSLNPQMIVWEDDEKPVFERMLSIAGGDSCNVTRFRMSCHTGTHMDAPCHFFEDGKTVDEISLDQLMGDVFVAEVNQKQITAEVIGSLGLPDCQRILFNTGSSALYQQKGFNPDFSALTESGAQELAARDIKLVGIDYLSIEHPDATHQYPAHQILLDKNIVILEGLNLSQVSPGWYQLMALPLKLSGTDGAPIRALLFPPNHRTIK